MHSYALVVARPGRRIPPWTSEILATPQPADLPFVADSHLHWSDEPGRTEYGGWQRATDALGIGSHWCVRSDGLTAFSGYLWPVGSSWRTGATWSEQLADRCRARPLTESVEEYQGVYTALSVSPHGDGGIAADPLAFAALYRAESEDVVAISTRPTLAARLVTPPGRRPERDALALASLAYCTFAMENRTGFAGVTTVPPGTCIVLSSPDAPGLRTWSPRPWLPRDARDTTAAELVDEVRRELASTVRAYAEVPAATSLVNLTGGKDSRLVLALLVSEGMADRFVFNTFGAPSLPDCVVATEVAKRFGLRHEKASPPRATGSGRPQADGPAADAYEQRLRYHLWMTNGLMSTWDLRAYPGSRPRTMVLTGLLGESLRSVYPDPPSFGSTMEDLLGLVYGTGHGFDAAGILTADARTYLEGVVARELDAAHAPGGSTRDALDGFYLNGRLRRWFGPQPDIDAQDRVYPLYSLRGIRAAYTLGGDARRDEILPFELMRATCPELAAMRFSSSPWPDAALRRLPDADRYRRARPTLAQRVRARVRRPPAPTANREEQHRTMATQVAVLRAQLDIGADHELFSLIDRASVLAALDRFAELSINARRSVHGAVTAAMWLSGGEARPPIG